MPPIPKLAALAISLFFVAAGGPGCGPSIFIPIAASPAPELGDASAFEILIRSSVADPVPLRGSKVAYSQLGPALTQQIAAAAQPWVSRHRERGRATDGWQLLLRLTEVDASYHGGHARVLMAVRATLRTRIGNQHVAQTQTYCRQTAEVAETAASAVFEACLHDLRTELSRWLGGVTP